MARKSRNEETVTAETEIVESVAVLDEADSINEEISELPETVQTLVDGEELGDELDGEDTGEDDDDTSDDEPTEMERSAARKIVTSVENAHKDVQTIYSEIEAGLTAIRTMPGVTDEMYNAMRNAQLVARGLTGDIDADALRKAGVTVEQLDAARLAMRNPTDDYLNILNEINSDPHYIDAYKTVQAAYNRLIDAKSRLGLMSKVSKTFFQFGDNPQLVSNIVGRVGKTGGRSHRINTPRGDKLIAGLDVTSQHDGADWHLTTSANGNGEMWRLTVTADGVEVYDVFGKTLQMQGPDASKPTLAAAVNQAIVKLKGNGSQRSVNKVFSVPVYANQVTA